MTIPTGVNHLQMLSAQSGKTRRDSELECRRHAHDLQVIGTSLSILYQAATCHRECHGGPHILESLVGRAYNLGLAAFSLTLEGLYDESLSLIRSLGEISNLISLSVVDKVFLDKWLAADDNTKGQKIRPQEVRTSLKKHGHDLMYADDDWYSSFCKKYSHANQKTKPNTHNEENRSHVGSMFQSAGMSLSLGELATVLGFIALPICKYFKFDDLYAELLDTIRSAPDSTEPIK